MTGTVSHSPAELGLPFLSPQPLWQCSVAALAVTTTTAELSGPWRLLLLGDGSPTRHLELLTGAPVEVELIAMAPDSAGDGRVPAEVGELSPPLLRRQVWLRCGGQALAWAESWWKPDGSRTKSSRPAATDLAQPQRRSG